MDQDVSILLLKVYCRCTVDGSLLFTEGLLKFFCVVQVKPGFYLECTVVLLR